MTERDLQRLLRETPLPDEEAARDRAWAVVRAAFAEREPVSWPRRHARPLVVAAVGFAVVVAALSPPGRAVLDSVRDRVVGEKHATPALFSLPAPGRLLAVSDDGAWIVDRDGSRRRLGDYAGASWSPHGLFVVATRRNELVAVDPKGKERWSLARPAVRSPRWAGSRTDTRIAYVSGSGLRVVGGDGKGDRAACADAVARVAPAWRPGRGFVLAFGAPDGQVNVYGVERCALLWRSAPFPAPRLLEWASDARRLLLVTRDELVVFSGGSRSPLAVRRLQGVRAAAFAPRGHRIALVRGGEVLLLDADRLRARPQRVFAGSAGLEDVAWSPDGRWLLVSSPRADQWIFVRAHRPWPIRAVSNIAEQFGGAFPRLDGWCCG